MKDKTALQQLQEWMYNRHTILTFSGIKMKADELLQVERQQIEDAFEKGNLNAFELQQDQYSPADYFKTTFLTNKN